MKTQKELTYMLIEEKNHNIINNVIRSTNTNVVINRIKHLLKENYKEISIYLYNGNKNDDYLIIDDFYDYKNNDFVMIESYSKFILVNDDNGYFLSRDFNESLKKFFKNKGV